MEQKTPTPIQNGAAAASAGVAGGITGTTVAAAAGGAAAPTELPRINGFVSMAITEGDSTKKNWKPVWGTNVNTPSQPYTLSFYESPSERDQGTNPIVSIHLRDYITKPIKMKVADVTDSNNVAMKLGFQISPKAAKEPSEAAPSLKEYFLLPKPGDANNWNNFFRDLYKTMVRKVVKRTLPATKTAPNPKVQIKQQQQQQKTQQQPQMKQQPSQQLQTKLQPKTQQKMQPKTQPPQTKQQQKIQQKSQVKQQEKVQQKVQPKTQQPNISQQEEKAQQPQPQQKSEEKEKEKEEEKKNIAPEVPKEENKVSGDEEHEIMQTVIVETKESITTEQKENNDGPFRSKRCPIPRHVSRRWAVSPIAAMMASQNAAKNPDKPIQAPTVWGAAKPSAKTSQQKSTTESSKDGADPSKDSPRSQRKPLLFSQHRIATNNSNSVQAKNATESAEDSHVEKPIINKQQQPQSQNATGVAGEPQTVPQIDDAAIRKQRSVSEPLALKSSVSANLSVKKQQTTVQTKGRPVASKCAPSQKLSLKKQQSTAEVCVGKGSPSLNPSVKKQQTTLQSKNSPVLKSSPSTNLPMKKQLGTAEPPMLRKAISTPVVVKKQSPPGESVGAKCVVSKKVVVAVESGTCTKKQVPAEGGTASPEKGSVDISTKAPVVKKTQVLVKKQQNAKTQGNVMVMKKSQSGKLQIGTKGQMRALPVVKKTGAKVQVKEALPATQTVNENTQNKSEKHESEVKQKQEEEEKLRIEKEIKEREEREKAEAEKIRIEKERAEAERLKVEKENKEREERERAEAERLKVEKEKREKEEKEKAEIERLRIERENREKEEEREREEASLKSQKEQNSNDLEDELKKLEEEGRKLEEGIAKGESEVPQQAQESEQPQHDHESESEGSKKEPKKKRKLKMVNTGTGRSATGQGIRRVPKALLAPPLENLIEIDLSYNRLTKFPEEFYAVPRLRILNLSCNQIPSIPADIVRLQCLEVLVLRVNFIEEVPSQVFTLPNLTELTAHNCRIAQVSVPSEGPIAPLRRLALGHNKLTALPENIGIFGKTLQRLCVDANNLKQLPESVGDLTLLTDLSIQDNSLVALPGSLRNLRNLEMFEAWENCLCKIPDEWIPLGEDGSVQPPFANVTEFYMQKNKIEVLPEWFFFMFGPRVQLIDLSANNLFELPPLDGVPNLAALFVGANSLEALPESLPTKILACLDISRNRLQELPALNELHELQTLNAGFNPLCAPLPSLPPSIIEAILPGLRLTSLPECNLPRLEILNLAVNNLTDIPAGWLGSKGLRVCDVSHNMLPALPPPLASAYVFSPDFYMHVDHNMFELPLRSPSLWCDPEEICPIIEIGVADTQGRRTTMEDSCTLHGDFLGDGQYDLVCMYDGHGGSKYAEAAARIFPAQLAACLCGGCGDDDNEEPPSMEAMFATAYHETNEAAAAELPGEVLQGTTAVAGLLAREEGVLHIANVGDTRAVMCRGGGAVRLSVDHKNLCESEYLRIAAAGGYVTENGRLQGVLAMSRALGDVTLKPLVSDVPHYCRVDISPEDEFVIFACDGVWDEVSDDVAVRVVRKALEEFDGDVDKACIKLRDWAFMAGSGDNISVIIIKFDF